MWRALLLLAVLGTVEGVADDFGKEGGTGITNRETILNELDRLLVPEDPKPAAVEIIFAEGVSNSWWRTLASFGHLAVAYRLNGTRNVMNIVGLPGSEMVNFVNMGDYLFGVESFSKTEQGGIYNRAFATVRIENVPEDDILAMHHKFLSVRHEARSGRAKFNIDGGQIKNIMKLVVPEADSSFGNCAKWTSSGLVAAGLMRLPTMFPKTAWIKLMEDETRKNASNVHVVYYRHARHAIQKDAGWSGSFSHVSFLHLITGWQYGDLTPFADAVVSVPKNTDRAIVTPQKGHRPSVMLWGKLPWGLNHQHHAVLFTIWAACIYYGFHKTLGVLVVAYFLFY